VSSTGNGRAPPPAAPRNGEAAAAAGQAGEGVIRLEVPCSLEYRDIAASLVAGACQLVGTGRLARGGRPPGPQFAAQVVSAFNEAFSNAVLHGDSPCGAHVELELEPHPDRLIVRLLDHGRRAFELSSVPPPDLDALPESGLGVHVMRSWMSDLSYQPGDPNVLSMTKRVAGFSRTDDGEETRLEIQGVLDAVTAPEIRATVEAVVAEKRRDVTVDLSALRLIDSSGVGVIVSLYKRCHAFGGTVRLTGLKDQPLQIFRLLRLDRVFAL
jgi:anti-anti-sigma factor